MAYQIALKAFIGSCCLISMVLVPLRGHGADLVWHVEDRQGRPVAHAVVALVPESGADFTDRPTAEMDQRNRQFVPHVLAVRTNTLVHFPNSDDIRHHVYSFSPAKRFELRLYHGATADPVLFDQPGQVALGCNIHDSMLGYIYVVTSEWYGVSDADGRVVLESVPAGSYQLQIQHPRLSQPVPPETLNLAADDRVTRTLSLPPLEPDPRQAAPDSELQQMFER